MGWHLCFAIFCVVHGIVALLRLLLDVVHCRGHVLQDIFALTHILARWCRGDTAHENLRLICGKKRSNSVQLAVEKNQIVAPLCLWHPPRNVDNEDIDT